MADEKEMTSSFAAELSASRPHLLSVAYRMLGSRAEAEDAVQEAWLRVNGTELTSIENRRAWLTTVVARVCLDLLRQRKARPERTAALEVDLLAQPSATAGPEQEKLLVDSVSAALLVMMETLSAPERLAFVLHDLFDLPFEQVAEPLGCSIPAARQLASRARRRLQGARAGGEEPSTERQHEVVQAFLIASRTGDLAGLLAVLHPEVELRADACAVAEGQRRKAEGAPPLVAQTRGGEVVARTFMGRASAARPALVDGRVAAVWAPDGSPRAALLMTVVDGRILAIDIVAEPADLAVLDVKFLSEAAGT